MTIFKLKDRRSAAKKLLEKTHAHAHAFHTTASVINNNFVRILVIQTIESQRSGVEAIQIAQQKLDEDYSEHQMSIVKEVPVSGIEWKMIEIWLEKH